MWLNQNENYAKKTNRPNFLLPSKKLSNQRYLKYPLAKNIWNCCAYIINKSLIHCDMMAQEDPEKKCCVIWSACHEQGLAVSPRQMHKEWCSLLGIWYCHPYHHCRHQTFPTHSITKSSATQYMLDVFFYHGSKLVELKHWYWAINSISYPARWSILFIILGPL